MTNFIEAKLAQFRTRRTVRRQTTEEARRRVSSGSLGIEQLLAANRRSATDDPAAFADYFCEDLPSHLHQVLSLELLMLDTLEEGIAVFHVSDPTDRDYRDYCGSVRQYLVHYIDLLRAQEEMPTSCLVDHYTALAQRLYAASKQVSL